MQTQEKPETEQSILGRVIGAFRSSKLRRELDDVRQECARLTCDNNQLVLDKSVLEKKISELQDYIRGRNRLIDDQGENLRHLTESNQIMGQKLDEIRKLLE